MDADIDTGLLNIPLADPEDDADRPTRTRDAARAARTAQSATAFQDLKATYRPKMENGEIWRHAAIPLPDEVAKGQAQDLLHAVEELYFFRRYDEGVRFVDGILAPGSHGRRLHVDVCAVLDLYRAKCRDKLAASGRPS